MLTRQSAVSAPGGFGEGKADGNSVAEVGGGGCQSSSHPQTSPQCRHC